MYGIPLIYKFNEIYAKAKNEGILKKAYGVD